MKNHFYSVNFGCFLFTLDLRCFRSVTVYFRLSCLIVFVIFDKRNPDRARTVTCPSNDVLQMIFHKYWVPTINRSLFRYSSNLTHPTIMALTMGSR